MSGPRNMPQTEAITNAKTRGNTKETSDDVQAASTHADTSLRCITLNKDEMICGQLVAEAYPIFLDRFEVYHRLSRCDQLATEGYPKPERCKVHHGQYRILYKRYMDMSTIVDGFKDGAELPTHQQIGRYTDWHAALEKARWVHKYLEAIQVERAGRQIHQTRFFLKVDDDHRRRLKLLKREMAKAVKVLDALQRRAYELYQPDGALHAMDDPALSPTEVDLEKQSRRTTKDILESIHKLDAFRALQIPRKKFPALPPTPEVGDEDLIDMSLRVRNEQMIAILKPFIDFESFIEFRASMGEDNSPPKTEFSRALLEKQFFVYEQFARRIILHEHTLFMKSLERVSFKDFILSDDFSTVDLARFLDLSSRPLEFPLKWLKDAALDALATSRHDIATNVGSVEGRTPVLGGWIHNRSHATSMSNEAWWFILTILRPPADVENCFVRLCNNFDDLIGFLSFGALGLIPAPSFCQSPPRFDINDSAISRNHLSLSGIIVADMMTAHRPPDMCRPMPTAHRATKQDCIVWAEMELRAYMFGAMRNEPDAFVEAFLRELRARPDLFQVVLRSETAPGREVEMFGSGPSNNEALPPRRSRTFEAPPSSTFPSAPASTRGEWDVYCSAVDVLFGTRNEMLGYRSIPARGLPERFFRVKTFPVTYFVILDTVPNRDQSVLARNVSWAALRAGGYAEGEYTVRKYEVASDKLFEKCAQERLGWMPKDMEWSTTNFKDPVPI